MPKLSCSFCVFRRVGVAWQLILQSVRGSSKRYSFAWYCLKLHLIHLQMRDYNKYWHVSKKFLMLSVEELRKKIFFSGQTTIGKKNPKTQNPNPLEAPGWEGSMQIERGERGGTDRFTLYLSATVRILKLQWLFFFTKANYFISPLPQHMYTQA